jgi:hypothetical protein
MFSMTESDLYSFLTQWKLGVLGSINPAGFPEAALVGIAVTPQLEIVFDTLRTTRKYRNLIARPACSFVIGCVDERTVQYEGQAEELRSPEIEHYREIYFRTWPDGPARMSWPGITYFVVRPSWIRYSSFDRNPPLIQEFLS